MASTPDDKGYWLVGADGGVFSFGDAGFYGSEGGAGVVTPFVGIAPTADGHGYWIAGDFGNVYNFGDAPSERLPRRIPRGSRRRYRLRAEGDGLLVGGGGRWGVQLR